MMNFANTMGRITAPFSYAPFLGSVGSKSTYFPGDVSEDAKALNFLGFLSDEDLAEIKPSGGTLLRDQSTEAGAWDPDFRGAMTRYQVSRGLENDSWVGPSSRARMAADVKTENARPGTLPPAPPPGIPVPIVPGEVPAKPVTLPGVAPVSEGLSTGTMVAIGASVLAIAGAAWFLLKK